MKFKSLLNACLLIFAISLFPGCKDDDDKAAPVLELQAADNTYSLKDARIFLRGEGQTEGGQIFTFRRYIITDGELASGHGFYKVDYENATYFIILQLGIPDGTEWAKGEFQQYNNWSGVPNGINVSYLTSNFDWEIDRYYTTHASEHTSVSVSGGFDPGDKISIKFEGNVQYHRLGDDQETWIISNEPCTLNFTGEVVDARQ